MQEDVRYRLDDVVRMTRLIDQMMCCGVRLERVIARCDPDSFTWHLAERPLWPDAAQFQAVTYRCSERNVLSRLRGYGRQDVRSETVLRNKSCER